VPEEVGYISGQIVLEGDEISYDNTRNFVIQIPQNRSILLVDGNTESSSLTSYIAPAVEAAQQTNARLVFDKQQPDNVRQGSWDEYDGIVFDGIKEIPQYWHQELRQYVQEGGGILFFPSEQGDIESYNQFFARFNAGRFDNVIGEYGSFETVAKMGELEEGHPILRDIFNKKEDERIQVDLPSLYYYYHHQPTGNARSMPLLKVGNQDPLLVEQSFGEGVFIISAIGADPGWSNFPVNALFAPLFYRTVLYASSPETGGLQQHQLGKQFEWEGDINESDVSLLLNEVEYAPDVQRKANGVRISYDAKEWEPGILTISSDDQKIEVAVNQNIMESYFETLDEEQWHNMLSDKMNTSDIIAAQNLSSDNLDEQLSSVVFGKEIWNWFIWVALLFLVTETLISRLYKAESIS
jgi:signal peptidase I